MRAGRSSTLPTVVSTEPAERPKVRWRLDIAYDGTNFSGWAVQAGLRTVQGELETWIARVLRMDEQPRLVCAGRTDAGVHARGQVAHLDLDATVITDGGGALTRRLNKVLGGDCVVRRISAAPPGFDARFGAIWRRYIYRLSDASVPPDPLYRNQIAQLNAEVDLVRLNEEAVTLLGLRDFGAFCRQREGATHDPDPARVGRSSYRLRADGRCDRVQRARGCLLSLDGPLTRRSAGRGRHGAT